MNWKKILSGLLLVFVLITIGFAFGKEVTIRKFQNRESGVTSAPGETPGPTSTADSKDHVIVYYFHGAVRCKTCNGIEASAHEVVNAQFAEDQRDGRVVWHTENFQEREDLAKRYEITFSTVVVVEMRAGKETGFERLDMVWELTDDVEALQKYIALAIAQHLKAPEAGGSPQ
jgi:hypothetical protein